MVLFEFTIVIHLALFPSCVAEGSRSGEGFQVCLERGSPRLELEVADHLTLGGSCTVTNPAESDLC